MIIKNNNSDMTFDEFLENKFNKLNNKSEECFYNDKEYIVSEDILKNIKTQIDNDKNILNEMAVHIIKDDMNNIQFEYEWHKDRKGGIVDLVTPKLYQDKSYQFEAKVYYFGYKFNNNAQGKKEFINYLKRINSVEYEDIDNDLTKFLRRPIIALSQKLNGLRKIDKIVYPGSDTSSLNKAIIYYIEKQNGYAKNDFDNTYEMIKNNIDSVIFNEQKFRIYLLNKNISESQIKEQIIEIKKKLATSKIFSIKEWDYNNQIDLRQFFSNFLMFRNQKIINDIIDLDNNSNILLLDDLKTSGRTINEMLNYLKKLSDVKGKRHNYYVFTMFGY